MTNSYLSGTLVQETAQFYDLAGALVDPATVTLSYTVVPSASETPTVLSYASGQITRVSQGVYQVELDTTGFTGIPVSPQVWTLQWNGTGTCQAISVDCFSVTAPPIS